MNTDAKTEHGITESLLRSIGNEDTISTVKEFGETTLDILTQGFLQSEVLTGIPVIGVLTSINKGISSYQNYRFIDKICSFLFETTKASQEDIDNYRRKLGAEPEECRKAADVILDIIDKITSKEKAVMVGKIFRAFMHEDDLTTQKVIHLCEIIERTYLDDLISIRDDKPYNDSNLEAVGIKKPIRHEDIDAVTTELSHKIFELIKSSKGIIEDEFMINLNSVRMKNLDTKIDRSGLTDEGSTLKRLLTSY